MATKEQLEAALMGAHKAGDTKAAKQIAGALSGLDAPEYTLENIVRDAPRSALRQTKLLGRNAIEGLGQTIDFINSPLRFASYHLGLGDHTMGGDKIADAAGLPKPEHPVENVVSEGQKILAGGGGLLGAFGKASQAKNMAPVAKKVFASMAANPSAQLASLTGAGTAGGVAKELDLPPWAQLTASLGGGLAAPYGMSKFNSTVGAPLKNAWNTLTGKGSPTQNAVQMIDDVLRERGSTYQGLPALAKMQLQEDMKKAMTHGDVNPDIARRLVDYRLTGATPTAGPLTQDPGLITKQKNLAKLGAQSTDGDLQMLSQVENANAKQLTTNLNAIGASTADDALSTGEKIIKGIKGVADTQKGNIDDLYGQARNTQGRSAELSPAHFAQRAGNLLDEKLLNSKLPADARNLVNDIAEGKIPLTVDVAEQLKTRLFQLGKSSADKQERMALGLVRQALEETPLLQQQGQSAINAFNVARSANRKWAQVVEKTPALKAVVDEVEPDKFVSTYITGNGKNATIQAVTNLKKVIKDDPGAMGAIKNYIARFLKEKALNSATDEMGKFSQSAYNKALNSIGDRKLKLFFEADDIEMLKAVGRVASYEQVQPIGAAVNNSNSATTFAAGALDMLGNIPVLKRVPIIAENARGASSSIQAGQMLNIPKQVAPQVQQQKSLGVWPFAMGGLLTPNGSNSGNSNHR